VGDVIEQFAVGSMSILRRRRFGVDRLYIEGSAGHRIGWMDLTTGERVLESADEEEIFERVVAGWPSVLPFGQAISAESVLSSPRDATSPPGASGPQAAMSR
jgi:hypothetical protein